MDKHEKVEALLYRAYCLSALGENAKAIRLYEEVISSLPPDSEYARRAQARLDYYPEQERHSAALQQVAPPVPETLMPPAAVPKTAGRRRALVIGNGNYVYAGRLLNPSNDGADIAAELQKLNFRVTLVRDGKYREIEDSIRRFGRELGKGDIGLLYFAGHGIQLDGENYLIPTDANLESPADLKHKSVPMNWVLDTMREAQNGFNVIIFDACRNNPFPTGQRAGLRGLAAAPGVQGALIAYSTSPGDVALDGSGRNSPYATALLKYMRAPDVLIEQMFKMVRIAVQNDTNGKQTPWELSSLTEDFYFSNQR